MKVERPYVLVTLKHCHINIGSDKVFVGWNCNAIVPQGNLDLIRIKEIALEFGVKDAQLGVYAQISHLFDSLGKGPHGESGKL
jgi:hypothetical protein